MSTRANRLYDIAAARSAAQRKRMEDLEAAGICVFCTEHATGHQPEPIEHMGDHWYVTKNRYPYEGTQVHYLIVARRHVTSFDEMPDEAGAELWSIKRMLKAQLDPAAIATVERSGNMLYNGGSVAHLHIHLVALEPSPSATVRFRVSAYGDGDRAG
jgi:ATP adenylyltransferase